MHVLTPSSHTHTIPSDQRLHIHTPKLCVMWIHAYLMHVHCGYILSFKHISLERKYLYPETLISTHIHKRKTHCQTSKTKGLPTLLLQKSEYIPSFMIDWLDLKYLKFHFALLQNTKPHSNCIISTFNLAESNKYDLRGSQTLHDSAEPKNRSWF